MSKRPPVSIEVKNCSHCPGRIRFTNDIDEDGNLTHMSVEEDGKTPHLHKRCPGCKIKVTWDSENGFRMMGAKTIKRHNCAKLQKLMIARNKAFPGMGVKIVPLPGIHDGVPVPTLDEVTLPLLTADKLPSTIGIGYEQKSPYTEEEKEKQWTEYKKAKAEFSTADKLLLDAGANGSKLTGEAIDALTKKLADTIARIERLETKAEEAWKNITNLQELEFQDRTKHGELEGWLGKVGKMIVDGLSTDRERFKPADEKQEP